MILAVVVEATTATASSLLPSNATRIQFQGTAELNASESDSIFPRPPYMQSRWIVTR